MSQEIKKVTEVELEQIKIFRSQRSQLAFALGDLELKKEDFLNSYKRLVSQEETFFNTLTIKYGDGNIDINTGEITPINE